MFIGGLRRGGRRGSIYASSKLNDNGAYRLPSRNVFARRGTNDDRARLRIFARNRRGRKSSASHRNDYGSGYRYSSGRGEEVSRHHHRRGNHESSDCFYFGHCNGRRVRTDNELEQATPNAGGGRERLARGDRRPGGPRHPRSPGFGGRIGEASFAGVWPRAIVAAYPATTVLKQKTKGGILPNTGNSVPALEGPGSDI